jgi:hypothetical protein
MEKINEYEIDGLIQTLRESGMRGIFKYTDVLVLNHMVERGWVSSDRDKMIKELKEQTDFDYNGIINLLNRYEEWKEFLPSYSLGLNQKLDSINKKMNSVIPFRWVDKGKEGRLLGFVSEGDKVVCYDGSGNHLMMICEIDSEFNVHWNNYPTTTTQQQRYILGEIKGLKERNKLL